MPTVDVVIEHRPNDSTRVRQVEALFDVPPAEKETLEWSGEVPLDERGWNVGLIVGPSGCGKTTVAGSMFKEHFHPAMSWSGASVIDDVAPGMQVKDISEAFASVGFNTIPAWRRPYSVLSTGERFRVELARRMLELGDPIVVDEFTSVVDRQVAKIGAHAVQKYVRRNKRQFVAVTCHYDVEDWLQPDWVLEPATMTFRWRSVQRRPQVEVEVCRVDYKAWWLFAPFHYLTNTLHKAARCYVAFVDGQPTGILATIKMTHPKVNDLRGISRVVTLPDWQGLGIVFVLADTMGAAHKAIGERLRSYPAHPALVRSLDRSKVWTMIKKPGHAGSKTLTAKVPSAHKSRPCAVFEYVGPPMEDKAAAMRLIQGYD